MEYSDNITWWTTKESWLVLIPNVKLQVGEHFKASPEPTYTTYRSISSNKRNQLNFLFATNEDTIPIITYVS
jgi:hypothetical protein